MPLHCDLQIHINGHHTFFLNQKIISKYSSRLNKIISQEEIFIRQDETNNLSIQINDFPGGVDGFELVSRFCYNNGSITITPSNVSLLHSCALYLGMTEDMSPNNLLKQTKLFLKGMFYWTWNDLLFNLKSCEPFYSYADSSGLAQKLIDALLAKIAGNSSTPSSLSPMSSSPSSTSSPDSDSINRFSSQSKKCNPKSIKSRKAWWFDGLMILPPKIMEKVIQSMGASRENNKNITLTRFLIHYLKEAAQSKSGNYLKCEYVGLAETAVYGVILVGHKAFSCRGLFWVLRIVSGFGLSSSCRNGLERLIGGMLDEATLDDLLISGHDRGGVYDVNLVVRLVRMFVDSCNYSTQQKLHKVGKLIDQYLGEISPDQNLKISKFLGVAQSLPDSARDCYDGVYRAIDIYLESHPKLSFEERSRLCECLNYEKLCLEACKDLAKNPRIPPRVAMQALISQQSKIPNREIMVVESTPKKIFQHSRPQSGNLYYDINGHGMHQEYSFPGDEKEDVKLNLQRMQWRVVQLERLCREMKGQMSRLIGQNILITPRNRALPRFCLYLSPSPIYKYILKLKRCN